MSLNTYHKFFRHFTIEKCKNTKERRDRSASYFRKTSTSNYNTVNVFLNESTFI